MAVNRQVDRLANQESGSTLMGPEPTSGIHWSFTTIHKYKPSTVKFILKGEVARIHVVKWRKLKSWRQAKIIMKVSEVFDAR